MKSKKTPLLPLLQYFNFRTHHTLAFGDGQPSIYASKLSVEHNRKYNYLNCTKLERIVSDNLTSKSLIALVKGK